MATYYFSRVSITMEPDYLKKLQYLDSILSKGDIITYRKDNYRIINLITDKIDSKTYLTGQMVKFKPEHQEETVNENKLDRVTIKNVVLAKVNFVFDANESLLIYQEAKNHIPKASFIDRFIQILEESTTEYLVPISIVPITDTYTFIHRLKEIKQIKKISISLHPSNPNNRDRWKKIDDKLKKDEITDYKEILENKKPGGSVIPDEETISKIMMGEDGYGKTLAIGLDENGESVTISTDSKEAQAKATTTGDGDIREDVRELQAKVKEIKNKQADDQPS